MIVVVMGEQARGFVTVSVIKYHGKAMVEAVVYLTLQF